MSGKIDVERRVTVPSHLARKARTLHEFEAMVKTRAESLGYLDDGLGEFRFKYPEHLVPFLSKAPKLDGPEIKPISVASVGALGAGAIAMATGTSKQQVPNSATDVIAKPDRRTLIRRTLTFGGAALSVALLGKLSSQSASAQYAGCQCGPVRRCTDGTWPPCFFVYDYYTPYEWGGCAFYCDSSAAMLIGCSVHPC